MNMLSIDSSMIKMLIPVIVLQIILQVVALVDLYKRESVVGGKKWVWVLVIIFGEILGPAIYLIVGRKDT